MKDAPQKKPSREMRSSSATEEVKVIELADLEPEVAPPKKAVKVDGNSTPSRQRKKKEGTTEIESSDKTTTENTIKKPAGTGEVLELPSGKKVQTSTTKPSPMLY